MRDKNNKAKIYQFGPSFGQSDEYYCISSDTKNFYEYRFYDGDIIKDWPKDVLFTCLGQFPTDLILGGLHYFLVSESIRRVLVDNNISGIQFLPVKVIFEKIHEAIGPYWVINVYREVGSLRNYLEGGDIFRQSTSIYVSNRTKRLLEEAGAIRGCDFRGISDKLLSSSEPRTYNSPPKFPDIEISQDELKTIEFYDQLFKPIVERMGELDVNQTVPIIGFDAGGPLILSSIGQDRNEPFVSYITSELALRDGQKTGEIGQYELMMTCNNLLWCRGILTGIGRMTFDELFQDKHTLDIRPWVNEGFPIQGIVFEEFCTVLIDEKKYGVLNCIGVTRKELEFGIENSVAELQNKLKLSGIYPNTDVHRKSTI
jgi:hypothetical protein